MATAILDMTAGEGVDAALEMSGDPTAMHQAFRAVKNGGRVTLFGIPTGPVCFDLPNEVIFKGVRVYGITGRHLFGTWYRLAGLFKAGLDIRPVVTHSFPLGDILSERPVPIDPKNLVIFAHMRLPCATLKAGPTSKV